MRDQSAVALLNSTEAPGTALASPRPHSRCNKQLIMHTLLDQQPPSTSICTTSLQKESKQLHMHSARNNRRLRARATNNHQENFESPNLQRATPEPHTKRAVVRSRAVQHSNTVQAGRHVQNSHTYSHKTCGTVHQ
jgi:hypothetical protein